jgi:thiamine biosynthesis lipoprotein
VSVANPADFSNPLCEAPLDGRALSTSGVREQHFERDGRTYSHLIDPTAHGLETAAPLRQVLQVTVLAPTSMLADALSTAMFLLGHDRGGIALEQFSGCSALWIYFDPTGIKCQDHNWPVHGFLPWKEGNHG